MKALELLYTVYKDCKDWEDKGFAVTYPTSDLNQAIKELEDLQNRSCNNCRYNKEQDSFMIYCEKEMCQDNSKIMWHSFTKDFCCKFWELK